MSTNLFKLNQAIKYSGVKLTVLAYKIGISRTTLWSRLNNHSEFTPEEIKQICNLLHLNEKEKEQIFNIYSKRNYIPKRFNNK